MARGIPKPPTPPQKVEVTLLKADYDALVHLASEQYRTPELQAGFMLRQLLAAAGTDHAKAIMARMKNKQENGEAH